MRTYDYDVLQIVKNRWSPRAFSTEKIPPEDVCAILEAARYAPSCFNSQPWRYIVAQSEKDLLLMQSFLLPKNLLWAKNAPVLMLVISENIFEHNGTANTYAHFDTGTSWGILSLEAVFRGYQTHCMAGFKKNDIREALHIPSTYDILAMIALGKPGRVEDLDPQFVPSEKPGERKVLKHMMLNINHFSE